MGTWKQYECKICGELVWSRFMANHLATHDLTIEEYYAKYIDSNNVCDICGNDKRFISMSKGFTCGLSCGVQQAHADDPSLAERKTLHFDYSSKESKDRLSSNGSKNITKYNLEKSKRRIGEGYDTEAEVRVGRFLESIGLKFRYGINLCGFRIDFLSNTTILEIDGNYHDQEEVHCRDLLRTELWISNGYQVVRVRNEEILSMTDSQLSDFLVKTGFIDIRTIFQLQDKLNGRFSRSISVVESIPFEDRLKITRDFLTAMQIELGETLVESGACYWKQITKSAKIIINKIKEMEKRDVLEDEMEGIKLRLIREELIDVFHFFISSCICSGMTPSDVFDMYITKNKYNNERKDWEINK